MGWPQYTYIAIVVIGLLVVLAKEGEPRGVYNFWESFGATTIVIWLLWMGGFFTQGPK